MCDKETIEIYEKIWYADVIHQIEPLYSIATSIVETWVYCPAASPVPNSTLSTILAKKLISHWKILLIDEIKRRHNENIVNKGDLEIIILELKSRYRTNKVLTDIVNVISNHLINTVDIDLLCIVK